MLYDNPNKTYIKSNTATIMRLLWFVSALLLMLVFGFCVFVAFGGNNTAKYHWDKSGQFYYTLNDGNATIVRFVNDSVESYTVPSSVNYGGKNYSVTAIGEHAFTNHPKLSSVDIPDSVTEIIGNSEEQSGAFSGCTKLATVNFGNGVARIGKYAFKNCVALATVEFPVSVQYVNDGAFQGCLALERIQLNSNAILGNDCFKNCLNVNTLALADDVVLETRETQKAFVELSKLSNFVITENNPTYHVQTAGEGSCLLATTGLKNDTVVLGGCGATIPDGVTRICDWAWGQRAGVNLYVPSSVVSVGANSFRCSSICTDSNTKPSGWSTKIPVHTQAQLVTFIADGDRNVKAYIYHDANKMVYPEYSDIFADVESETPFEEWGDLELDGVLGEICRAVYQNNKRPAPATEVEPDLPMTKLNSVLDIAKTYIEDDELRLKFTIDFWEKFKTVYYNAALITNPDNTYEYIVNDYTQSLDSMNKKIENLDDTTILENSKWWVGLQNLIDNIDKLDDLDLVNDNDNNAIKTQLNNKLIEAQLFIEKHYNITMETGFATWRELRSLYESLRVNADVDSELSQEITVCKNLPAAAYTKASWQNLQDKLKSAEQVTTHNLSISTVREELKQAREDLREVVWNDNFVKLQTWISICNDLSALDYHSTEYEGLVDKARMVNGKMENLFNSTEKTDSAIGNLKDKYDKLIRVNNTEEYQAYTSVINQKSIPYFILVVMLFTGAVACGAAAARMKKLLRKNQE